MLGLILELWAFIQPLITILVLWFVFQVGFRSAPVDDFPLSYGFRGLIPGFFSDSISASCSLTEYSYLVKKVMFRVVSCP